MTADLVPDRSPEQTIARDMARRAVWAAPVIVIVAGMIWGTDGALSALFAIGLVVVNFLLSAALLTWAGRISSPMLMVAALGGFVVRLALITVVVLAVKDLGWVELLPLGLTLIVTHLGLLVWETRHISASLAHPVLAPRPRPRTATETELR